MNEAKEFLKKELDFSDRDIEYNQNITARQVIKLLTDFANQKDNWISVEEDGVTVLKKSKSKGGGQDRNTMLRLQKEREDYKKAERITVPEHNKRLFENWKQTRHILKSARESFTEVSQELKQANETITKKQEVIDNVPELIKLLKNFINGDIRIEVGEYPIELERIESSLETTTPTP